MTRRRPHTLLSALAISFFTHGVLAQTTHADSVTSARQFAQSFYDWYTRLAVGDSLARAGVTAAEVGVGQKPELFGPSLLAALRADFAATAKASGEIVGLDFDPFLGSQDPCARYQAGNVTHQNNSYLANVHAVCNGERSDSAFVIAEIRPNSGRWRFVNFRYAPGHADLLAELKILREQRRKS